MSTFFQVPMTLRTVQLFTWHQAKPTYCQQKLFTAALTISESILSNLAGSEKPHALVSVDEATRFKNLCTARDLHLMQLRIDGGRDDFAEEMEGRS